ncbi:DUF4230 domain-containing protein [Fulvivirga ligni]|uniref:DUF4230 domain-containing protein n=1 Tax=Fulvivirga ligni TaxID=2904246 RepID=UPI001F1D33AC|nr:DUF4230 domain-containing protein [Fulvivirga ligni]UII19327.1 DUF4230 domain-containing protein [Fulvivirga ligni]
MSCKQDKRSLVISKIQAAAKLATTETVIDKTVVGSKSKKLLGLIKVSEANFVAYTEATVKTGIDLNKLSRDDIRIEGKEISIQLPPVEVLDFSYPFQKFDIDSTILKDSWVNRFDVLDYEEFYRQAELDIRNQLQYTGIIEATQNKTRIMFQGLLKNLGYEAIFIKFTPTEQLFQPINMEGEE